MSALTKKKTDISVHEEIEDFAQRINNLELDMVEAKEFTHLSSEVFAILQNQINELKIVIISILESKAQPPKRNDGLYL